MVLKLHVFRGIESCIKTKYFFFCFGFNIHHNTYFTIADNLKEFQATNCLPPSLQIRCSQFETCSDLKDAFISRKAVFHKSCISCYDKQKLARKRKKIEKASDGKSKKGKLEEDVPCEQKDSLERPNRFRKESNNECFFCDSLDKTEKLHKCQTLSLHNKISVMATYLGDTTILSKLAQGDMVATDAVYHNKCLVSFNNRFRSSKKKPSDSDNCERDIASGFYNFSFENVYFLILLYVFYRSLAKKMKNSLKIDDIIPV